MAAVRIGPAATLIEWELIKGDSFDFIVPVFDEQNQPINLDGWTGKAQVRRSEDDPVIHEWSTSGTGGAAIALSDSEVILTVDGAVTSTWATGSAHISVEIYAPVSGKPHTIAYGTVRALAEYTQ